MTRRPLALVVAAALVLAGCASAPKRLTYTYAPVYGVDSPEFVRSLDALRSSMVEGNRVTLLENGDGVFPAMLAAIHSARRSVNIETYLFADGAIAHAVTDALVERARAGVEVRVLVDDVGMRMGDLAAALRAAGGRVKVYKPIKLFTVHRIQDRTHRRLVIVDGEVGFVGGFGIDDRWRGDARGPDQWRDLAVKVEGPVVRHLQRIFMEDWLHTTGEVLHGDAAFPAIERCGEMLVQAVPSSRGDQSSMAKLLFYMSIQAARRRIWIENAYFVPDAQIRTALAAAAKRGVDVRVVVPGKAIDIPQIRTASRFRYGELLAAGVKIYEFTPAMLHTKAMTVDGVWSTVGTINLVARSMRKNAEVSVAVYNERFATELEAAIEHDIASSKLITLEGWRHRSVVQRIREVISYLFSEAY